MSGSGPHRVVSSDGLRVVSTGLIAYGVVSLVITLLGLVALAWVNVRVGSLVDQVDNTVTQLATTTQRTADVLHNAAATSQSFTTTLDHSAGAVASASASLVTVTADLQSLEAQLRSVSIIGNQPLGGAADTVGRIATDLAGLDGQLKLISDSLVVNQATLGATATSLGSLGDNMALLTARLRSGVIESSLADLQTVLVVAVLVFTAWMAVPAVGALAFGVWLRRTFVRSA